MRLSERMRAMLDLAPECAVMADIGSDHALLPIAFIRAGKALRAIASDISEKSLQKAVRNIGTHGMESTIELRTGDGLSVLRPGEAQLIVISGLGGEVIADILESGREALLEDTALLLSPNRAARHLREFLAGNGFEITDEDLVLENRRFYPILLVRRGAMEEYTPLEYEFGRIPIQKKHPRLKELAEKRIRDAENMEKTAAAADNPRASAALKTARARLEEYRRLLTWL